MNLEILLNVAVGMQLYDHRVYDHITVFPTKGVYISKISFKPEYCIEVFDDDDYGSFLSPKLKLKFSKVGICT